jgi:TRAP-type C4-dicarboxylate transport system permease small subunit
MDRVARALARFLENLLGYVFLLITLAVVLLVVLRYFFLTTIVGGQEFTVFCFIYTSAIGAAVLLYKGEHISIPLLVDRLPAGARRWMRRMNYLEVALLNGLVVWLSIPWIRSVGQFPSPVLRIPQGVVLLSIPVGCGLVTAYALWLSITDARRESPGRP